MKKRSHPIWPDPFVEIHLQGQSRKNGCMYRSDPSISVSGSQRIQSVPQRVNVRQGKRPYGYYVFAFYFQEMFHCRCRKSLLGGSQCIQENETIMVTLR